MADLDLDELERVLEVANASYAFVHRKAADTILDAAPALIAAARERDRLRAAVDGVLADVARWREHTEARARGGQHVGTGGEIGQLSHSTAAYLERVLGHVGGAPVEVDRLRSLCREAAEMLARVQARDLEEWEPDEPTEHWSEDLEQRLRAAGGGT